MDKHYCSSADCTKICSGEPQFFFLLFIPHTSAGKKNPESHKRVRAAHPTLFFFCQKITAVAHVDCSESIHTRR